MLSTGYPKSPLRSPSSPFTPGHAFSFMKTHSSRSDPSKPELQEAYEQLMSNARERGHVRNQLLSTQAELAAANKELTHWAQHASETDSPAAENRTYSRLLPPGAESQSGDIGEGSEQHIAEGRNEWSVSSNMDRRNHSTEVAQMMNNLSELSGQMATDAVANEAAFQEKPAHGHYNPSN